MKADAWMPLYVNDYLGATMRLTTEQHGAYLLLIMEGWKSGGPIPDDDAQLAAIAKMTLRDWRKIAPVIRRYFTSADGELHQGRLSREIEKAQRLSDARRESGSKGGRPRKANGNQKESEPKPIGFSDDNQDGLQTETPARVAQPSPSPPPGEGSEDKSSASPPVVIDPDGTAWQSARLLLRERGDLTSQQAGSFFGGLLKQYGLQPRELLVAITQATVNGTLDPRGYLTAAAKGIAERREGAIQPKQRVGFV